MNDDLSFVITPKAVNGKRLRLLLSETDRAKIGSRGARWTATVTDTKTGKRYRVRGASCGLPRCFCDAIATEVTQ